MTLEDQFTAALRWTYEAGRARGYIATYFLQMLDAYGGVETAKRLLAKRDTQAGLYKLWELDLLGDSMEAVVLQERYRPLFTEEEIAEAQRRLEKLDYFRTKI